MSGCPSAFESNESRVSLPVASYAGATRRSAPGPHPAASTAASINAFTGAPPAARPRVSRPRLVSVAVCQDATTARRSASNSRAARSPSARRTASTGAGAAGGVPGRAGRAITNCGPPPTSVRDTVTISLGHDCPIGIRRTAPDAFERRLLAFHHRHQRHLGGGATLVAVAVDAEIGPILAQVAGSGELRAVEVVDDRACRLLAERGAQDLLVAAVGAVFSQTLDRQRDHAPRRAGVVDGIDVAGDGDAAVRAVPQCRPEPVESR